MTTTQKPLLPGQREYRVIYTDPNTEPGVMEIVAFSLSEVEQKFQYAHMRGEIVRIDLVPLPAPPPEPPAPVIPEKARTRWKHVIAKICDLLNLVVEDRSGQMGIPDLTNASSAGRLMYDTAVSLVDYFDLDKAKVKIGHLLYAPRRNGIPFYRYDAARELYKTAETYEREIREGQGAHEPRKYRVSYGTSSIDGYAVATVTVSAGSVQEAIDLFLEKNPGCFVTAAFIDDGL